MGPLASKPGYMGIRTANGSLLRPLLEETPKPKKPQAPALFGTPSPPPVPKAAPMVTPPTVPATVNMNPPVAAAAYSAPPTATTPTYTDPSTMPVAAAQANGQGNHPGKNQPDQDPYYDPNNQFGVNPYKGGGESAVTRLLRQFLGHGVDLEDLFRKLRTQSETHDPGTAALGHADELSRLDDYFTNQAGIGQRNLMERGLGDSTAQFAQQANMAEAQGRARGGILDSIFREDEAKRLSAQDKLQQLVQSILAQAGGLAEGKAGRRAAKDEAKRQREAAFWNSIIGAAGNAGGAAAAGAFSPGGAGGTAGTSGYNSAFNYVPPGTSNPYGY